MIENKNILGNFFEAFQKRDWQTMQTFYHDEAVFLDPVFANLSSTEVKAMWHMLCSRAKEFSLEIKSIACDEEPVIGSNGEKFYYCICHWEARYIFSGTGKKVHNKVKSHIKIYEGKILEQMDEFNVYRWSIQAFGLKGLFLGATSFFKIRLQKNARNNLQQFMEKEGYFTE